MGLGFYRGADCCALVYDLTDKTSFENLEKWRSGFIDNAAPSDLNTYPIVLFGNKSDKKDRSVSAEEVKEYCQESNDMDYYETSAFSADNVNDAFMCMIKKALVR